MGRVRRALIVPVATVLTLAASAGSPRPAHGQPTAADSAAVLLGVARDLEGERRDQLARSLYSLIVERYPDTPAAVHARERLDALEPRMEAGSGRTELVVWSTLYGLWLGVAVPAALGVDAPEPYGLGLLIGGPGGFLASKSYSGRTQLTEGQARAMTFGGLWGTWQGLGWRAVLDLGSRVERTCPPDRTCYDTEETPSEVVFRAMVLGGLAGLGAGTAIARSRDVGAGTATAVNLGALWGTWYGWATSVLLDLEDDDKVLALTLLGGDAGMLATALLAPRWNLTRSRARLISIAGVAGLVAGLGLDLILQPESGQTAILLPLAGSTIGLALGAGQAANGARRPEPGQPPETAQRAQRRESGRPGGSLLQIRNGALRLDVPAPVPALIPIVRHGQRAWVPGARVALLDARF